MTQNNTNHTTTTTQHNITREISITKESDVSRNVIIGQLLELKDPHNTEEQLWFQSATQLNTNAMDPETFKKIITNNTDIIDFTTAQLLNIDPETVAKIHMIKNYIIQLWQYNNIDNQQTHNNTRSDLNSHNDQSSTYTTDHTQSESSSSYCFKNILQEEHYETRNRKYNNLNPYHVTPQGEYIAGALIANTPGEQRSDQVAYIAYILSLPKDKHNLIHTAHINGNGWIIFHFQYEWDLDNCIEKINNKQDEDFKILKLNHNNLTTPLNSGKNHTNISRQPQRLHSSSPKPTNNIKDKEPASQDATLQKINTLDNHSTNTTNSSNKTNKEKIYKVKGKEKEADLTTTFQPNLADNYDFILLDIPSNFTAGRVKGALKHYGQVNNLTWGPRNNNFKSAIFNISNTKTDIKEKWAIPLGDKMARLTPYSEYENTLVERNQITTRLYGINKDTTAVRIMSATKHLNAKTVHIPLNSKTGKRRGFAILSFKTQEDLTKAIFSHVELFGTKTWWSTKDNSKITNKQTSPSPQEHQVSPITKQNISEASKADTLIGSKFTKNKESIKAKKEKGKGKTTEPSQTQEDVYSILLNITKRLGEIEDKLQLPNFS